MSAIKKHVLFLPGSGEGIDSRDYRAVLRAIEEAGHTIEFVPIAWSRTKPSKWKSQLMKTYAKYNASETVLAGFSFGAVTALLVSAERNPAELWLFSLSPYFAENFETEYMKPSWLRYLGARRVSEFRNLSFKTLAKRVTCPTLLFYGSEEFDKYPIMKRQASMAHNSIANSILTVIPKVGHDVARPAYITAIKTMITRSKGDS